jgi:hypothetical protein
MLKRFEVPEQVWKNIVLPKISRKSPNLEYQTILEKRIRLEQLKNELSEVEQQIQERLIELGNK